MAKKKSSPRRKSSLPAPVSRPGVTPERFSRLYRMLHLLSSSTRSRDWLIRQLKLDVRGFYRDLEFLRAAGITVHLHDGAYSLEEQVDEAVARLPFPDPHLSLGEVRQLARGRSALHQRLGEQVNELIS